MPENMLIQVLQVSLKFEQNRKKDRLPIGNEAQSSWTDLVPRKSPAGREQDATLCACKRCAGAENEPADWSISGPVSCCGFHSRSAPAPSLPLVTPAVH